MKRVPKAIITGKVGRKKAFEIQINNKLVFSKLTDKSQAFTSNGKVRNYRKKKIPALFILILILKVVDSVVAAQKKKDND